MTEKSKDQLRDHVERQLADKGSLLTFSPMVKARYEEETGTARCRHLVICGLVALALYNVFLISDWRLIPDIGAPWESLQYYPLRDFWCDGKQMISA